jgi:hypothetical protein
MDHRTLALVAVSLLLACSRADEVCDDGVDDDDDTLVDCADPDCAVGARCSPLGLLCDAESTCSTCGGNGGVPETDGEATCGDGADNDCDGLVDCADPDCQPQGDLPGGLCDAAGHVCGAPDGTGASTCGGGGGGTGGAEAIGAIRLAEAEHVVLGAFGSGYQEQSLLTFEVRTPAGAPYPGLAVAFSHVSLGGSFIGAAPACSTATPPVCTAQGVTDPEGRVGVLLRSGRTFGMVSVRAQASAAGATRSFVAGNLAVVGAKPSGARFAVDCRPYDVPALTAHDCVYSRYAGTAHEVTCTATLGDRHDNLVAVPTLVGFQTEAGLVAPADETPAFDPARAPPPDLGQAVGVLETYGAPLPFDVDPFPGERSLAWDAGCGPRTANPRDGLVTVLALVQGEEGFVDLDLDGTYDPGEPFVDLGEPFLDVDDDGVRDPGAGEWFLDLDQDGLYTGPNGVWDADTVLWAQTRILYTGYPARHVVSGQEYLSRVYLTGSPPDPTPVLAELPPVHAGPPATTERFRVFFADQNLNPLSSFSEFDVRALAGNVEATLTAPIHTADSIHMAFRQLYCDTPDGSGACADGPADQACTTSPCHLVTRVGPGYHYGNYATGSVTGAKVGTDVVQILATVERVTTPFEVGATCVP